ncbi:pseudouridine synthase [Cupriavidus basilensis]
MSQFSAHPTRPTLADCVQRPGVYPAGRLDADSEGLLLLTDDGALQARIADPHHKLPKTYLAQVENKPTKPRSRACAAGSISATSARCQREHSASMNPASSGRAILRCGFRAAIPTQWLEIEIREGKTARCGA